MRPNHPINTDARPSTLRCEAFAACAARRFALALLLTAVVACVGRTFALADARKPAPGHVLTIEEAIDIAKRCIVERNIHVAGSFIESARFERNARGDHGPFWRVTWAHAREIKGGQVFVTVFSGRTCQVTYGE
jgi:hypothetical protein